MVLVGPAGSGKSHFAAGPLPRATRSSRPTSCARSSAAVSTTSAPPTRRSTLLERIVAGRLSRGLTTVVDTLGLDRGRRRAWLDAARERRAAGRRGRRRHPAGGDPPPQRRPRVRRPGHRADPTARAASSEVRAELDDEGWDLVHVVTPDLPRARDARGPAASAPTDDRRSSQGLAVMLQVARFPWGEDPGGWLRSMALAADEAGFAGLARDGPPDPDPAGRPGLGADPRAVGHPRAGRRPRHRAAAGHARHAGDLPPGRRHGQGRRDARRADRRPRLRRRRRRLVGPRARGVRRCPFPPARERLDALEAAIETMRALWAPGTKAYAGERVSLPETTSYPRPAGRIPVIVGGNGERRTLAIAARLGDGCNLPSDLERARPQAGRAALAPRRGRSAVRRPRGHRARPARRRSRPRRRLGAGREAARPHRRGGVRREEARGHGRPAARPLRPGSPSAASARCSCPRPTSTAPTTCSPWPA